MPRSLAALVRGRGVGEVRSKIPSDLHQDTGQSCCATATMPRLDAGDVRQCGGLGHADLEIPPEPPWADRNRKGIQGLCRCAVAGPSPASSIPVTFGRRARWLGSAAPLPPPARVWATAGLGADGRGASLSA